jgi:hypothetical protein
LASVTDSSSALEQAKAAFERGNYAEVRRLVSPLLASLPNGDERDEAEELWSRIQPDPWMSYLLVLSLLLLVAVTAFAYSSSSP